MEILDDDFTRESSPEDEAAIRKLNIESLDVLKDIRNGRVALIVLAGFALAGMAIGIFQINSRISSDTDEPDTYAIIFEGLIMLLLYVISALSVKSYPKMALLAGSGIYICYNILYFVIIPSSVFSGILLKLVMIYFLGKAVVAGFQFETFRAQYRQYHGRDLTV